jgi:hypothetical protein
MPAGLAAGKKGEPPTSGQWELLTTTNATKRGTRKNESRKPIRHSDHGTQRHTGIHAGSSHRIDRYVGPVLGSSAGSLRRCRHTRPCDCAVTAVHSAGRRETSTSNSRLSLWYGGRTSIVLSVETSVPRGTGKCTSAASKCSLSKCCAIVASKRPTLSQVERLARYCLAFISSPLPCLRCRSCLSGDAGLGQFGPIVRPVIGAKLLPRNCAVRNSLDIHTTGSWDRATPHLPLMHGGRGHLQHAR